MLKSAHRILLPLALAAASLTAEAAFLETLENSPSRIPAPLHAAGGDIVLRELDDYVHIFTNAAAAATFIPNEEIANARVLLVAGGGSGGGSQGAGGGGAGGMVETNGIAFAPGTYTITVGAGGAAMIDAWGQGNAGGNSSISNSTDAVTTVAIGGGGGGQRASAPTNYGGDGGSGGGAGNIQNTGVCVPGTGIPGQGNDGGSYSSGTAAGGGGGAGAVGQKGTSSKAGDGGAGKESDILGFSQTFAGGGGGAYTANSGTSAKVGAGGAGGGGNGGGGSWNVSAWVAAGDGVDGLGGGGGGSGTAKTNGIEIHSGKGGDGIVIIRYTRVDDDGLARILAPTPTPLFLYDGEEKVSLEPNPIYVISGIAATNEVGSWEYTVAPAPGYKWDDDGTTDPKPFSWNIFPSTGLTSQFLLDLATDANRVASSPYATGGDIILKEGDDYIHVFFDTNVTAGLTFAPSKLLDTTILAVGGGGGGGARGGGGGAGGMLLSSNIMFMAGSYSVQVGVGGLGGVKGSHYAQNGGDSYILAAGDRDVVRAFGGGRGASMKYHQASSGGSGGGSMTVDIFEGVSGQGNAGGKGSGASGTQNGDNWALGGGGGAGGPGSNGNGTTGVSGGPGLYCDILGFDQAFAGGGGSGSQSGSGTTSSGGIGGGGRGSVGGYGQKTGQGIGETGTDGLGGGGGGGGGNSNFSYLNGGNGGNGIVIIRYTPPTGPEQPAVALYSATPSTSGVEFSYAIGSCGQDESDATVYLVWGYADDALRYTNTLATMVPVGPASDSASRFYPGRSYQATIYIENDQGQKSVTPVPVSFTMPNDAVNPTHENLSQPMFGPFVILDATGGDYIIITGKLARAGGTCAFADCDVTFRWGPQAIRSLFVNVTNETVQADGTFRIRCEGIDSMDTRHGELEVENAYGDIDRVPVSFTTADTATYRWKADAWEGDWRDPANWDGAPNEFGVGYPTDNSIADFTSTDYATVYVSGTIRCSKFLKERNGAQYTFVGTTDGAQVIPLTRNQRYDPHAFAGGQYVEFDHMDSVLTTFDIGSYKLTDGDHLILRDGAQVKTQRGTTEDFTLELSGADTTLELYDGSSVVCGYNGLIVSGASSEVIAENGSHIKTSRLTMSNGTRVQLNASSMEAQELRLADKADTTPATIVLNGLSPSITGLTTVFALQTNANIRCLIPTNGWPTARIVCGNNLNNVHTFGIDTKGNGCPIVFNVPATAKIKNSRDYSTRESQVVSWPKGIDFTKVGFGTVAQPGDYFYFSSTNDQKYVLCSTNSAMIATADLPAIAIEEPPMMTGIWYFHATHPAGTILFLR